MLFQIYETWYGDQDGTPCGPPIEFLDSDDADDYCDVLNQRSEVFLYIAVAV